MDWIEVTAPKVLCLYDLNENNTNIYYKFLEQLDKLPKNNFVQLDLSNVERVSAAAALYLFAHVIGRQLYISNNFYKFKLPKNPNVVSVFKSTGLDTVLKPGGTKKIKKLWQNDKIQFLCGNNNDVPNFLKRIRTLTGHSVLPQNLGTALKETFLNINHHAYSGPSNLVHVTWFSYFHQSEDANGKYLAALIADRGIGIPTTIRKSFSKFRYQKDCYCIEKAMLQGVTSTNEMGRGQGSVNIQRPVQLAEIDQKDSLLIISGKGQFELEKKIHELNVKMKEMECSIIGSILEWRLYY